MKIPKQEIREKLKSNAQQSNRAIAADIGVNDKIVGTIHRQPEAAKQIPVVTKIRGLEGKLQRRKTVQTNPVDSPSPHQQGEEKVSNAETVLTFPQSRFGPGIRNRVHKANSIGGVLDQIRTAFTGHPLAFQVALPLGFFVPGAVWCLVHLEALQWWHWCLVAGGALFSSLTVIEWGRAILRNLPKAVGFAVLVEGVMLASQTQGLSLSALVFLVIINATCCAVALAFDEAKISSVPVDFGLIGSRRSCHLYGIEIS